MMLSLPVLLLGCVAAWFIGSAAGRLAERSSTAGYVLVCTGTAVFSVLVLVIFGGRW